MFEIVRGMKLYELVMAAEERWGEKCKVELVRRTFAICVLDLNHEACIGEEQNSPNLSTPSKNHPATFINPRTIGRIYLFTPSVSFCRHIVTNKCQTLNNSRLRKHGRKNEKMVAHGEPNGMILLIYFACVHIHVI